MSWKKITPAPRITGSFGYAALSIRRDFYIALSLRAIHEFHLQNLQSIDLFYDASSRRVGFKFYEDDSGSLGRAQGGEFAARLYFQAIGADDTITKRRYRLQRDDAGVVDAFICLGEGDPYLHSQNGAHESKGQAPTKRAITIDPCGLMIGRAKAILRDYANGATKKQLVDGYSDIPPEKIEQLIQANVSWLSRNREVTQ